MDMDSRLSEPPKLPNEMSIDLSRLEAQKARVLFLITSLCIVTLNMASGAIVYKQTNSITMMLDLVGFGSDICGLIVNMVVEVLKGHTKDPRRRFKLDLLGCFVSMLTLSVVVVWGIVNATITQSNAKKPLAMLSEDKVDHVVTMFIYSLFSLVLSLITITLFMKWFGDMYPHGFGEEDRLNTVSSLAHTCVDFTGTCAVLCTSLTMVLQENQGTSRWTQFQAMTKDDVIGSSVMVTVTLLLMLILSVEAWKSFRMVQTVNPPEVGMTGSEQDQPAVPVATLMDAASPFIADSTGQTGYGSTESDSSPDVPKGKGSVQV